MVTNRQSIKKSIHDEVENCSLLCRHKDSVYNTIVKRIKFSVVMVAKYKQIIFYLYNNNCFISWSSYYIFIFNIYIYS